MTRSLCGSMILVSTHALATPELTSFVIATGGGQVGGLGNMELSFTIGQPEASAQELTVGTFRMSGGYWPAFVAPVCAADFNSDGSVDFFDYLDFVAAFSTSDPAADFNSDSSIDFFDYLDFVAAFSIGC